MPGRWVLDASIVTIYKKGDRTDCGKYRGISLLSIADKIFDRILLNRLSTHITPEVVLHTGMMANVSVGGEASESFSVTNGVKQGCVLPPPCSSPSFYQQCSMRLSETWEMESTYSPDRELTYSMSHTSERKPRLLGY